MIHIGHMIEAELKKQGRSKTWFAQQICCTRENVYRILRNENIDYQLLKRISIVLNVNFTERLAYETQIEMKGKG